MLETIVSVAVGGFISAGVSWWFFHLASKDMKKASDKLIRLNNLMLHAMEHNGWIELNRDDNGNIKGFTQRIDFNKK